MSSSHTFTVSIKCIYAIILVVTCNNYPFYNAYCEPNAHLIFTITPRGKDHYYPHIIDKITETWIK
jgi:hypothetical protein